MWYINGETTVLCQIHNYSILIIFRIKSNQFNFIKQNYSYDIWKILYYACTFTTLGWLIVLANKDYFAKPCPQFILLTLDSIIIEIPGLRIFDNL